MLRAGAGGFIKKATGSPQHERVAVFGFVALCVAWSAGEYTDLFIPDYVAADVAGPGDVGWLVKAAQKAGLLGGKTVDDTGDTGWFVPDSDNLFHVRTLDEVQADRDRRQANRDLYANMLVFARDGDTCRYCLRSVSPWMLKGGDNMSARARTIDHVDPTDPDTERVVACRSCNSAKNDRPLDEWVAVGGHGLKPAPEVPRFNPKTIAAFLAKGGEHLLPPHVLAEATSDQPPKQSESKATSDQRASDERPTGEVSEQAARVGSGASVGLGLVGSGSGQGGAAAQASVRPLRPVGDGPGGAA